jgi:hypothetical protein
MRGCIFLGIGVAIFILFRGVRGIGIRGLVRIRVMDVWEVGIA